MQGQYMAGGTAGWAPDEFRGIIRVSARNSTWQQKHTVRWQFDGALTPSCPPARAFWLELAIVAPVLASSLPPWLHTPAFIPSWCLFALNCVDASPMRAPFCSLDRSVQSHQCPAQPHIRHAGRGQREPQNNLDGGHPGATNSWLSCFAGYFLPPYSCGLCSWGLVLRCQSARAVGFNCAAPTRMCLTLSCCPLNTSATFSIEVCCLRCVDVGIITGSPLKVPNQLNRHIASI